MNGRPMLRYSEIRDLVKASGTAGYDRLVFIGIAMHADTTGEATTSADEIAGFAGVHPASVRRIVRRLVAAGRITVDHHPGSAPTYALPVHQLTPNPMRFGVVDDTPNPARTLWARDPEPIGLAEGLEGRKDLERQVVIHTTVHTAEDDRPARSPEGDAANVVRLDGLRATIGRPR